MDARFFVLVHLPGCKHKHAGCEQYEHSKSTVVVRKATSYDHEGIAYVRRGLLRFQSREIGTLRS